MSMTPEQKRLLAAVIEEAIWVGRACGELEAHYRDPPRSLQEIEQRQKTYEKLLKNAKRAFMRALK